MHRSNTETSTHKNKCDPILLECGGFKTPPAPSKLVKLISRGIWCLNIKTKYGCDK